MPHVIFEESDGTEHEIDARLGATVMNVAVTNGVPGIIGECGGSLSCASCHVYVDDSWIGKTGTALDNEDDQEDEMLDGAMAERRDKSRLSCQIIMVPELDGLRVEIPPEQ